MGETPALKSLRADTASMDSEPLPEAGQGGLREGRVQLGPGGGHSPVVERDERPRHDTVK